MDFIRANMELVWIGIFVLPFIILGLAHFKQGTAVNADPQCSPSRKNLLTGRKYPGKATTSNLKRTIHQAGGPIRWQGLERSIKEREKVKR